MRAKLANVWWLVLLGGLVEVAFIAPFFEEGLQEAQTLILIATLAAGIGGLLELLMVFLLRGHFFQGILRFVGVADVLFAILFWVYSNTLGGLLVMTGLWLIVRGFAALWLGLSIVERPLDRAVPTLAGLVGLGIGTAAMLWLDPRPEIYVALIAIYGASSALVHIVLALRLRADRRRIAAEQQQQAEQESPSS